MQAAIDNGMILPNHIVAQAAGKLAAGVGEKPVLYDVYLSKERVEDTDIKRQYEPDLKVRLPPVSYTWRRLTPPLNHPAAKRNRYPTEDPLNCPSSQPQ